MPDFCRCQQRLTTSLSQILPGARLAVTPLPQLPSLRLLLLDADYPQHALDEHAMLRVMNNPLYWIFCWASGQVLAQFLLAWPERVRDRRVVDFGCGSGVVAIAAAQAGAREAIACDIDPLALEAARINAELNQVTLTLCDDFDAIDGAIDLIIAADVLYDQSNFPWLQRFVARASQVLIADSRVRSFDYPPYRQISEYDSCTVPDLDESMQFRQVRLYQAG